MKRIRLVDVKFIKVGSSGPANRKVLCPLCTVRELSIYEYMAWVEEKQIYKCKVCGEVMDPTEAQAQIQPQQQQQQQEQLEPINHPIYRKPRIISVKVNRDNSPLRLQNPFDF